MSKISDNVESLSLLTFDFSIALAILPQSLIYNQYIQPIKFANNPVETFEGSSATASGWGVTETGDVSDVLLWTTVKIISQADCVKAIDSSIKKDQHLCKVGEGISGVCEGNYF